MTEDRYREETDEKAAQSSAMMLSLRDGVVSVLMLGFRFWWVVLPLFFLASVFGAYRIVQLAPQLNFTTAAAVKDDLTIVVQADSTAVARDVIQSLRERLKADPTVRIVGDSLKPTSLSGTVLWPLGDDLSKGVDRVVGLQPFLVRLRDEGSDGLTGAAYLKALKQTLEDDSLGAPSGALPALKALEQALSDGGSPVSWSGLIRARSLRDAGMAALYLNHTGSAEAAVQVLRAAASESESRFGVGVALTGRALWSVQEAELSERRFWISIGLLVTGLVLLVYFAFHSLRAAMVLGLLLLIWGGLQGVWLQAIDLVGLPGLFGLGVSLIAMIMASVDVVDRYRDAESQSRDQRAAARTALQERVGAFALTFISLPVALLGFLFFAYGELATFAHNAWQSVTVTALLVFFAVPASLRLLGVSDVRDSISPMRLLWAGIAGMSFAFGRTVVFVSGGLLIFGLGAAPFFTPLFGQADRLAGEASVEAHNKLLNLGIGSPWNLVGEVGDERTASSLATRLAKIPQVQEVIWAGGLISPVGTRERSLLSDSQILMGIDRSRGLQIGPVRSAAFDPEAWSGLRTALLSIETHWEEAKQLHEQAGKLLKAMTGFEDRYTDSPDARQSAWGAAEKRLLQGIPAFWRDLQREIIEPPPSRREASKALEGTWVAKRSGYRIEVVPAFELDDGAGRAEFVREVTSKLPRVRGYLKDEFEWRETLLAILVKSVGASLLVLALFASLFACRRAPSVGLVLLGGAAMLVPIGVASVNAWPIPGDWIALLPAMGLLTVVTGFLSLHRIVLYEPAMGNLLLSSTGRGLILGWAIIFVLGMSLAVSAHPSVSGVGLAIMTGALVGPFLALVLIASLYAPKYSVSES